MVKCGYDDSVYCYRINTVYRECQECPNNRIIRIWSGIWRFISQDCRSLESKRERVSSTVLKNSGYLVHVAL